MKVTKRRSKINEAGMLSDDYNRLCFDLWVETGSLKSTSERLAKMGIINRFENKPFKPPGIRIASSWYLIEHFDEAQIKLQKAGFPIAFDTQKFYEWVIHRASVLLLGKELYDYLHKTGLWEYANDEIRNYAQAFGDIAEDFPGFDEESARVAFSLFLDEFKNSHPV